MNTLLCLVLRARCVVCGCGCGWWGWGWKEWVLIQLTPSQPNRFISERNQSRNHYNKHKTQQKQRRQERQQLVEEQREERKKTRKERNKRTSWFRGNPHKADRVATAQFYRGPGLDSPCHHKDLGSGPIIAKFREPSPLDPALWVSIYLCSPAVDLHRNEGMCGESTQVWLKAPWLSQWYAARLPPKPRIVYTRPSWYLHRVLFTDCFWPNHT